MPYSTRARTFAVTCGVLLTVSGCVVGDESDDSKAAAPAVTPALSDTAVTVAADDISTPSYEAFALDTAGTGERLARFTASDAQLKRITPQATLTRLSRFPATVPAQGPSTLQLQILLDRAGFSPGILDGMWGDNAAKALRWFRFANGIDTASADGATTTKAVVDQATYEKLAGASSATDSLVVQYTVTSEDVKGPFVSIPEDVYEQAKLECLCYASAVEGLAERFHTSRRILAQLNPGVKFDSIAAGTMISVPNVATSASAAATPIAKLVISRTHFWTHAVDASGRVIQHFPSTLGAGYDPSPTGDYRITNIAKNPTFRYQPKLFAEVADTKPEARLPKGPNSPVGVVWMAISKPHYGIHGTSSPETIGYANSHGCVRLTNWDARRLSEIVRAGTPVEFL